MMAKDLTIYKIYRKEYESKLNELDKDKIKIIKSKKSRKEKLRLHRKNTVEKLYIICQILKRTYMFYQRLYFDSDHYRSLKLE